MSEESGSLGSGTRVRRRRTRRHRRNRQIRRAIFVCVCTIFSFSLALVALHHLSPSLFRSSGDNGPSHASSEASRDRFLAVQAEAERELQNRPVYPYSIVPGGVRTVRELKWAAEHDPVVAQHYAGFDYDHARVVRLALARTAYISYRIGNKIYWTRHRVSLKKGETVITDGKMTARTRCANQVIEVPQQAMSDSEPPAIKFDEPIQPLAGTAMKAPAVPFQSSLNQPAPGPMPLGVYDPLGGGGAFMPVFSPPLPGVCGIGPKKPVKGAEVTASGGGKKKKLNPCSSGGGTAETPEPGTWLLVASGLAFLLWKSRQTLART